jgi:hypothetical protein
MANDGGSEGGRAGSPDAKTLREYQELWFALAKREWMSVVLVPAHPGGSAAEIGKLLAEIGTRLSEIPVTAIAVSSMGYDSAFALSDLQQHVDRDWRTRSDRTPVINVTGKVVSEDEPADAERAAATPRNGGSAEALTIPPAAKLIIAIPAVVSEPLGLAAAHSADAVILTVEMGRTRIADARRTVELIGRERIAGCFIVR